MIARVRSNACPSVGIGATRRQSTGRARSPQSPSTVCVRTRAYRPGACNRPPGGAWPGFCPATSGMPQPHPRHSSSRSTRGATTPHPTRQMRAAVRGIGENPDASARSPHHAVAVSVFDGAVADCDSVVAHGSDDERRALPCVSRRAWCACRRGVVAQRVVTARGRARRHVIERAIDVKTWKRKCVGTANRCVSASLFRRTRATV